MAAIQLFLQFEGDRRIELIRLKPDAVVRDILDAAVRLGFPDGQCGDALVFGAEGDTPLDPDITLSAASVGDKHRVHVHRCHQVEVTLHFNELTEKMHFPPSGTVDRVKQFFVKKIGMSAIDATEHVLQLCGGTDRPDADVHIGCLVSGKCSVCFDLVPIKRVEG